MDVNKIDKNSDLKVIILCIVCAVIVFISDSLVPLGVAGGVPYILIVLISLWSDRKKLPIYMAIIGSILTIIGFYSSPSGGELWKVLANRFLALFAIWVVTILSIQRSSLHLEKEKALSKVKILAGFFPICASCKNVRDDKGYWNQIETYISDNSEADFSHSICPECVKKLYPNINLSEKSEKNNDNKII